ncbi:hypothetical protein RZN05_19295 [Sphingomonas sp. HF-S4]|uniref:Uncharacterized protein n=1 Tax=Sphingomonas agrestis TaxID=3080540 RepID=A0ABU3YCP1_9SPHN|nr:hypothetical protein [Sphingomonas sp. HF-S4]MDV3459151.1 hypothetical protein [Sphingomonas sp. HF-S4]
MVDRYSGMTVNERLFAAGVLSKYEAAVAREDREAIAHILAGVGLVRDADGMHHDIASRSENR